MDMHTGNFGSRSMLHAGRPKEAGSVTIHSRQLSMLELDTKERLGRLDQLSKCILGQEGKACWASRIKER